MKHLFAKHHFALPLRCLSAKHSFALPLAAVLLIAAHLDVHAANTSVVGIGPIATNVANAGSDWRSYGYIAPCGQLTCEDQGGGIFRQTACTPDGGVCLSDSHGVTFLRQGISGPVHLPWYPVKDATAAPCLSDRASCDAAAFVTAALAAAKLYGDGGVTADKRSFVQYGADLSIPSGQYFTCGGAPGATRAQSGSGAAPYYSLPGMIALNPAHTVAQAANSSFFDCGVIPSTYTSVPASIRDVVNLHHNFTGTAITSSGEAVPLHDVLALGFDVCLNVSKSPRTVIENFTFQCNVNLDVGRQAGGIFFGKGISKQLFEQLARDGSGNRIDIKSYLGTAIANNGGAIQFTATGAGTDLQVGDLFLATGLNQANSVQGHGDTATGSPLIKMISPTEMNQGINQGDKIQDNGCTCGLDGKTVSFINYDDATDTYTVTASGNASADVSQGKLKFNSTSYGPGGANGYWLVAAKSGDAITAKGSSWTGPSDATASWKSGGLAIAVLDTTNIAQGQYICASGSAPYCTPPAGFDCSGACTATSADVGDVLTTTSTVGDITLDAISNVPLKGLVQCGSESMGYKLKNAAKISILSRGARGTTAAACANGSTLTFAAPTVAYPVPIANKVIVTLAATADGSGTVQFANDTVAGGTPIFSLVFNPTYQSWTADKNAGPAPNGTVTALANGTSGQSQLTLTGQSAGRWFKLHVGMAAKDLTSGLRLGKIASEPTSSVIALDTPLGGDFSGHHIYFDGCGWPTGQPWLGNCGAVSFLLGSQGGLSGQGISFDWLHSFGYQTGISICNSPATSGVNYVISGGGGQGANNDPGSSALRICGISDDVNLSGGRLGAHSIAVINAPSDVQPEGVAISNTELGTNPTTLGFANLANGNLHVVNSHLDSAVPLYEDAAAGSLQMSNNNFAPASLAYDDPAALANVACDANRMADSVCGKVSKAPSCDTGCASITGSDVGFDAIAGTAVTSVTVDLGGIYRSAPLCTMTTSPLTGAGATSGISSVAAASYGTMVTVSFSTAQTGKHIYGRCTPAGL